MSHFWGPEFPPRVRKVPRDQPVSSFRTAAGGLNPLSQRLVGFNRSETNAAAFPNRFLEVARFGPLAPGAVATVIVKFQPIADGAARFASILVYIEWDARRDSTHGPSRGRGEGPDPESKRDGNRYGGPRLRLRGATPTPGPNTTDKNSSNAPRSNHPTVRPRRCMFPKASDDNSTTGTYQVVVENAASVLPDAHIDHD